MCALDYQRALSVITRNNKITSILMPEKKEAMEQWNECLTKLRSSTRPDSAAVEAIIRELSALPCNYQ